MSEENTASDAKMMIEFLRFQVKELESQLKAAKATIANYQKAANGSNTHPKEVGKKQELPTARQVKHLSWQGKVIFVLQTHERPMTASELFDEVDALDGELGFKQNPKVLLSVVLHKAVKEQRLTLHKVKGTRGAYYALKEWTDKEGNLNKAMREQLF
jgi:hypothetical protein